MTFEELQREQGAWRKKNFPDQVPHQALLGVIEEGGEALEALVALLPAQITRGRMAHYLLKKEQGIRYTKEEVAEKLKDAIADETIFLSSLCELFGFDYDEIVTETWNSVKNRDWTKNPLTAGGTAEQSR